VQVQLYDLTKRFNPRKADAAVHQLNMTIASAKITVLLGPSGCGKTTTLKMVAGLLRPTSGDITFDGKSVLAVPAERRGAVMVFQNQLLFPYMTVGENVGFGLTVRGYDKATVRRRVEELLGRVQLPGIADRRPHQLSGGQQQRVALARALIVEPRVLLLDEPLSNLDTHLRDEMRELILDLQRQFQITTIMVTHDQQEAVMMADCIALMFDGRLRQYDVPSVFYRRPADVQTARFFGSVNFVPGWQRGEVVETTLGPFPVPEACHQQNGPCVITVRPEALRLGPGDGNGVIGKVHSSTYMGVHTRFVVRVRDVNLQIVQEAASVDRFRVGDMVEVEIPQDEIWVLPPEKSQIGGKR
jgi:ABC-type Fe3+/spermidine/putrescine transport system ATPase subunit